MVLSNMSHTSPIAYSTDRIDAAAVGTALTRLGLSVLALTVPVVAGAFAGLLATAGSPEAGMALALRALDGPLFSGVGLAWLFHVATLVGLCGCWLFGAGLLLEGLSD